MTTNHKVYSVIDEIDDLDFEIDAAPGILSTAKARKSAKIHH